MGKKLKTVTPPPAAVMQFQAYVAQRQAVEATIQAYAQGVKDGLSLEGDWDLSVETMVFTQRKRIPK